MKPGVRIPSSAPAAGCRTQVAHLTWWGVFFCACVEAGICFVNVSQKQKSPRASGGSFAFDRCAGGRSPERRRGDSSGEKEADVFLWALSPRRGLEPIRALDFFEAGARAERVFLRRKPHRSGFGGNSHSGLSFLFCLFARVYGGGAFGRRKPSGKSPLSSFTLHAVGEFLAPAERFLKARGKPSARDFFRRRAPDRRP